MPTRDPSPLPSEADVVVVGAGFGGLGAALTLAERGARVVLCEALAYPGGCASTFTRGGVAYESGATLFSGFAPGQLFAEWIARHGLDVAVDWLDPLVVSRTPTTEIAVPRERDALIARFQALPDAPRDAIARFFRLQRKVADALWRALDDPALLPPLSPLALLRHAGRLPAYVPLARLAGRPARVALERCGVDGFAPLVTFLDALCQITVQCGLDEAEAPVALATMDYYFRGTGHVRGGIGRLAHALAGAIAAQGGHVALANRVRGVEHLADGRLRVRTRRGDIDAACVVANLLPQDARALCGLAPGDAPELDRLAAGVETGWGAAMLYRVVAPPPGFDAPGVHYDLVRDPAAPLIEGNHVFCSIGEPHPDGSGLRSATVSTHLRLDAEHDADPAAHVDRAHAAMRATLAALLPEWRVVSELTASPRTFERFTRRHRGLVGGVPRRAGLAAYRHLAPREAAPGLWLVGDSVFPGQSTLATALGGVKVAEAVARRSLPARRRPPSQGVGT
ncbi:MAG: FAD-dependent oxidoreductase [Myxococcales bacterium]|nr:FAD-dependent oxidoreductase [Myxococcales bacterium]MCB9731931.1 FAD-dependent oxidoreductase [Deltaproteobacteria bacterium]